MNGSGYLQILKVLKITGANFAPLGKEREKMDKIITPIPLETPTMPPEEKSTEIQPTFDVGEKPLEESVYIKELFKMGEAAGQFQMPSLIKEIDSYVLSEIKNNNLENNRQSYKEIVENLVKRLNMPSTLDIYTRTERLVSLIRIQRKLNEASREREELLKKPVSEMTSKQLKDFIELKDKNVR